jgi:hypothetical protein
MVRSSPSGCKVYLCLGASCPTSFFGIVATTLEIKRKRPWPAAIDLKK